MIVCSCEAVSDRDIKRAIAEGHDTMRAISACTGAGTGCAQCRCDIVRMLIEARSTADEAVVGGWALVQAAAAK